MFTKKVINKYHIIASDYKVSHEDDELEVIWEGIGKAVGEFADLQDEDHALEMPPLGLDAYGEDEGKRIWKLLEDDGIDRIFYIHSMEVNPNQRAQGFGKKIVTALENEAKKHNIDAFMGNASPMGNKQVPFSYLKKFYTGLGYKFLTIYENKNGLIFKKV